jgi:predicted DNA-binding protein (UPF0278 family)
MTAYTMRTKDSRLLAAAIEDVERRNVERLFDTVIDMRTKLHYHAHMPAPTVSNLVRFMEYVLCDVFQAIDEGQVIHFKSPKPYPKIQVAISMLYRETYKSERAEMFKDLTERFKAYVEGEKL